MKERLWFDNNCTRKFKIVLKIMCSSSMMQWFSFFYKNCVEKLLFLSSNRIVLINLGNISSRILFYYI